MEKLDSVLELLDMAMEVLDSSIRAATEAKEQGKAVDHMLTEKETALINAVIQYHESETVK